MIKHTTAELKQMQSLPLDAKIAMTKLRIREWYNNYDGQVYVSFSGGKDSTVLKHIVDSMYLAVPSVFCDTGLEYPEIRRFVQDVKDDTWDCYNSDVLIIRPEMRFDQVIREYGYPFPTKAVAEKVCDAKRGCQYTAKYFNGTATNRLGKPSQYNCQKWKYLIDAPFKISRECCDVMKKKPFKVYERESGRKPIIGTLACESMMRSNSWLEHGCNAFEGKCPKSQPLSFWTEQDILNYIKSFNVPYCSIYREIKEDDKGRLITTGRDRTGCMFCMFGVHLEKEPNRFQQMQLSHPKQYAYCMDKLGLREVLEYVGVPYECKKEE